MTSNFNQNRIFEENLEINVTFNDAIFETDGQTYIVQHYDAIKNLKNLISFDYIYSGTLNTTNYFDIEYRWTFDNLNFTTWITLSDDFNNFLDPNINKEIWLQIRFTYNTDLTQIVELKELNIIGLRTIDEIFQAGLIESKRQVVYTNQDTYKVFKLENFQVYLKDGNINDLEITFRFTQTQGRIWSQWTPLTTDNLLKTKVERLKFCNFQFGFINIGTEPIYLYDLELSGEFQNITANYKTIAKLGLKSQCNPLLSNSDPDCKDCCVACSEALVPWNDNIESCDDCSSNFVQINDRSLWASQINLYNELNKFINLTNSWKCTYLLTDADGKGIDHVLHEQQIHNVIAMKDVNIVIPDNQFPVDNVTFSGLDLDLIQSFEIHIMKDAFKKIFGVEFRPSKKDIVYICDINQIWEVEQMFPKRGFMNAETYYRVLMKKYNDRASRQFANNNDGQDAKSFIDSITKHTTLDGLFGLDETSEIKRNTKDFSNDVENPSQQFTQLTKINIVKSLDPKITYINEEIWNATLTVSKHNYKIPIKSKNIKSIVYNSTDNAIGLADNRAISMWFKTEEYDPTYDYTLFSNYDYTLNKGYKLNMYQGGLTFTFNSNQYTLSISDMNINVWYCMLVNFDQVQQKLELAVYTRQRENGIGLQNSKLVLFKKLIYDIVPDTFIHNEEIFVGGCDTFISTGNTKNYNITNIRLYNQIIKKNDRNIVLNQYTIDDANLTIISDSVEQHVLLPQYGNL